MTTPRFEQTPFSLDAFTAAAEGVPRRSTEDRFVTRPHPAYVVQSAGALSSEFPFNGRHVGWQSILIEGEAAIALVEAAPDAMGRLYVISTIEGDLPVTLVAALAEAERGGAILEDGDYAIVSVPQIGLNALWLPYARALISVGPDVHGAMPQGKVRDEAALTRAVRETFVSAAPSSPDD